MFVFVFCWCTAQRTGFDILTGVGDNTKGLVERPARRVLQPSLSEFSKRESDVAARVSHLRFFR